MTKYRLWAVTSYSDSHVFARENYGGSRRSRPRYTLLQGDLEATPSLFEIIEVTTQGICWKTTKDSPSFHRKLF